MSALGMGPRFEFQAAGLFGPRFDGLAPALRAGRLELTAAAKLIIVKAAEPLWEYMRMLSGGRHLPARRAPRPYAHGLSDSSASSGLLMSLESSGSRAARPSRSRWRPCGGWAPSGALGAACARRLRPADVQDAAPAGVLPATVSCLN
jgi:hypothetical protein